jgi:3-hydroxyacyl-[acyl-carrier-protein] dehydratase
MPGVLLVEALAQAAALPACGALGEIQCDTTMHYFGGINAARFKRPIEPGKPLVMDVRLTRRRGAIMKSKTRGLADGLLAVEAELLCTRALPRLSP